MRKFMVGDKVKLKNSSLSYWKRNYNESKAFLVHEVVDVSYDLAGKQFLTLDVFRSKGEVIYAYRFDLIQSRDFLPSELFTL